MKRKGKKGKGGKGEEELWGGEPRRRSRGERDGMEKNQRRRRTKMIR